MMNDQYEMMDDGRYDFSRKKVALELFFQMLFYVGHTLRITVQNTNGTILKNITGLYLALCICSNVLLRNGALFMFQRH